MGNEPAANGGDASSSKAPVPQDGTHHDEAATPSASASPKKKSGGAADGSSPPMLAKRMKEVPVLEESPAMVGAAVVAGILGAIAIGMLGYGVQTDNWLEMSVNGVDYNMGLFDTCSNVSCVDISFNTLNETQCGADGPTIEGSSIQLRYWAIRGLFFFEAFGCFIICVLSLAACQRGATGTSPLVTLIAALVAMLGGAAGVGLWVMSIQGYFFCETTYCEMLALTSGSADGCTESFGLSFYIAAASMGTCIAVLVLAVVIMVGRKKKSVETEPVAGGEDTKDDTTAAPTEVTSGAEKNDGDAAPAAADSSAKQEATTTDQQNGSDDTNGTTTAANDAEDTPAKQQPAANGGTSPSSPSPARGSDGAVDAEKLEGDWVFDDDSGMYWSESNYLFLNPENGHYYNPNADQWFNPDTQEWYGQEDGSS